MFTLVKRWKIQISHRTEACWSVKLYSTWCRYNLLILYLTHKAIKVSSYHAAPLSGCRAESVNQPLEIWKRRQTGLLDLITVQTDPEAAVSQLRTQRKWRHTEHHSSFFLFHLLRNIRAGRQTCFGFDQRQHFLWVFVEQKMSSSPRSLSEPQKRTLSGRTVMFSDTTRTFLSRLFVLLLLEMELTLHIVSVSLPELSF